MRRCAYCGHSLDSDGDVLTQQQRMVVDFLQSLGRPVSAERIAAHIRVRTRERDRTYREDCNNVRVVICNIRGVLGQEVIQTIKGQGYVWCGESKGKNSDGKARTQEEARPPSTERATATGT